jgi:adenosylhomocysteinase
VAESGARRIRWVADNMMLLGAIAGRFTDEQPFAGKTIGVSIHLEPKTAALLEVLDRGGAQVIATGNLGTTQDDVVVALNESGIRAIGRRDDDPRAHADNLDRVAAEELDLILDNGADLVARRPDVRIIGGTEETTSGANRLRDDLAGHVRFPVIVINDSPLKSIVENQHGVGQSVMESFQRITNLMLPGLRTCVFGYGWCGRGIAQYASRLGARVVVVEPDPIKALEAVMDGFEVREPQDAVDGAKLIVTATGARGVVGPGLVAAIASGAILANAGHFDTEIDVPALDAAAQRREELADGVERLEFAGGHWVRLLTGGRMVNLGGPSPKGNSIEAMDLGFSLQALSLERIATRAGELTVGPQAVPDDINRSLAAMLVAARMAG